MSLRKQKGDQAAPGLDPGQALARDNVKFHDGLMRRAMQLRCLEQAYIVRLALMVHERADVRTRRRCFPRGKLRGHDHIYASARADQTVAALEPLSGIKRCALFDAKGFLRFLPREHDLPC